jgi:microsomal dipeptidase-like Zn-dependent dipeptidase
MNGIVGLYTLTFGLDAEDDSLKPFVRHFAHAVDLLGPEIVAIGSDGVYQSLDPAQQASLFAMLKEKIDPRGNFKARFPDQPEVLNTPYRMDRIMDRLLGEGFSETTVQSIIGKNAERFLEKVSVA